MRDKNSDGARMVRATFPYIVFISVFIVAMAGVMWWANGAVPSGAAGRSHAADAIPPDGAPRSEAPNAADLVSALGSAEPGVALRAIRIAAELDAAAVEAAGPMLLGRDARVAHLAGLALDRAVYETRDPAAMANALFRLLAQCLDDPALDEARRREAGARILAWIAVAASEEHVPALTALFGDPALGGYALAIAAAIPGPNALDALLAALSEKYPMELHMAAARHLAERDESTIIRPLMVASAGKPSPLGWLCLEALARQGVTPDQVFALPPTATAEESRRYGHAVLIASRTLARQGREDIAERLFLGLLRREAPPVIHRAAILGMSELSEPDILPAALGLVNVPGARASAIDALVRAKVPDLDGKLRTAYEQADAPTRAALLEVMSRRGAADSNRYLDEAAADENVELRETARRISGKAPSEEDLLALAARGNPWIRRQALTDYFGIAEDKLRQGDSAGAAEQFRALLEGPFADDDLLAALQGLARAGRAEDRPLIEAWLGDAGLGDAAWMLMTESLVAETDHEVGRAELTRILPQADTPARRERVRRALETLGAEAEQVALDHGCPTRWRVLGPLPNPEGRAFGKPFYPASRDQIGPIIINGARLDWDAAQAEGLPAALDLAEAFGETPDIACYLLTEVLAAEDTAVRIRLISTAPFECWINGEALQSSAHPREPDDAVVEMDAALRPGENRILIKSLRDGSDWGCALQVTDREGKPLPIFQSKQF